jgi:hypothetical protein
VCPAFPDLGLRFYHYAHPRPTYRIIKLLSVDHKLSDKGNDFYAYEITGDRATIYSFGTQTIDPVAVSYLIKISTHDNFTITQEVV